MAYSKRDALALADLIKQKHFANDEAVKDLDTTSFAQWYGDKYPHDKRLAPAFELDLPPAGFPKEEPQPETAGVFPVSSQKPAAEPTLVKPPAPAEPYSGTFGSFYKAFDEAGKSVGEKVQEIVGGPTDAEYWAARAQEAQGGEGVSTMDAFRRSLSTGAEGLVSGAPDIGVGLLASLSPSRYVQLAAPLLTGASTVIHQNEQGASATQAAAQGSAGALGLALGAAASAAGARYGLGPIAKAGAGYAANLIPSYFSQMFNDVNDPNLSEAERAEKNGSLAARLAYNWQEQNRLENLGALGVGEVGGALIHGAVERGRGKTRAIEGAQDLAADSLPKAENTLRDGFLKSAGFDPYKTQEALVNTPALIDEVFNKHKPVFDEYNEVRANKEKPSAELLGRVKDAHAKAIAELGEVINGHADEGILTDSVYDRTRNKALSLDSSEPLDLSPIFAAQDEAVKTGRVLTLAQASKEIAGYSLPLTKFLDSIHTPVDKVTFFQGDRSKVGNGFYDSRTNEVGVNFQSDRVQKALGTLVHEVVHGGLSDVAKLAPERVAPIMEAISGTSFTQRYSVLKNLQDATGIRDINIEYGAGKGYEQDTPRIAQEFIAHIAEFAARDVAKNGEKSSLPKVLNYIPEPLRIPVMKFLDKISRMTFGPEGLPRYYDAQSAKLAENTFRFIQKELIKSQQVMETGAKILRGMEILSPEVLEAKMALTPEKAFSLPDKLASVEGANLVPKALDELNGYMVQGKPGNKLTSALSNLLALKQKFPEITSVANIMHYFSAKVGSDVEGLHQDAVRSVMGKELTRAQAQQRWNEHELRRQTNKDAASRVNKVLYLDQRARDSETFDPSKLQNDKQMAALGLTPKDIEAVKIYRMTTELTAKRAFQTMLSRNEYSFAATLMDAMQKVNPNASKEEAHALGKTFINPSLEMGFAELRVKKAQIEMQKYVKDTPEYNVAKQKYQAEKQRADLVNKTVEQRVTQLMGATPEAIMFKEQLSSLGYDSVAQAYITSKQGYAPETRRGNFVAFATNGLDYKTFDHNSETKVKEEAKRLEGEGYKVQILDKKAAQERFNNVSVDAVNKLTQDRALKLNQIVEQLKAQYGEDAVAHEIVDRIQSTLVGTDHDLKAINSVRGDAFLKARKGVAGFNPEQYVPNIVDYSKFQTFRSERELAKAKMNLEMSDPFYKQNPDVAGRVLDNANYMFGGNYEEFRRIRQVTGAMTLLAGTKRFMINMMQPYVEGLGVTVDRMTNSGLSQAEALNTFRKGIATSMEMGRKGSVSDPLTNQLFALAKREGVFGARALEAITPTDEVFGHGEGVGTVPGKVMDYAIKALGKFDQVSEAINRQTSFLVGVEMAKKLNIKDPAKIYDFAKSYNVDVNYSGDKSNRPKYVQGLRNNGYAHAMSLLPMTMRNYALNSFHVMNGMLKAEGGKGFNYATGKRSEQNHIRTGFMYALGAKLAIAGASGLPFKDDIMEMFKMAGLNVDKAFREFMTAGEDDPNGFKHFLAKLGGSGIVRAATGIETATSAGSGNIAGIDSRKSFGENLANIGLGATGSSASNIIALVSGDKAEGQDWRSEGPVMAKQMLKWADYYKYGQPTDSKGMVSANQKLTPLQKIAYLGGFQVEPVIQKRELANVQRESDIKAKRLASNASVGIAQALREQDSKKARELISGLAKKAKSEGWEFTEANIASQVSDDLMKMYEAKDKLPTTNEAKAASSYRQSAGLPSPQYPSEVKKSLLTLEVALKLGLNRAAGEMSQNLGPTLQNKAVVDRLVQRGVDPRKLKQILSGGRLSATLESSQYPK